MGLHPVAVVQYIFTQKQYTEQHNGTEHPERNIHKNSDKIIYVKFRLEGNPGVYVRQIASFKVITSYSKYGKD